MHHPIMKDTAASSILPSSKSLRRGSWSEEEDRLLKKCIEKHGEGKWGQIPLRAGLNRCRKSCRLRWLNYLQPNIKRGEFEADEVDLIARMHKLLGNRWSLIAGRVPGRTANDIKNFYNTHLKNKQKRRKHPPHQNNHNNHMKTVMTEVLRPQPRNFSKISQPIINKPSTPVAAGIMNNNNNLDSNNHGHQLTAENSYPHQVTSKNVSCSDDYFCNIDDDQGLKEAIGDYWNNDFYPNDDLWRMLGETQDGQYLTIESITGPYV